MQLSFQKTLAVIQIILQLCPPSLLLYATPAKSASEPQNKVDPTENSIAQAAVRAGTLLASDSNSDAVNNALVSTGTGAASTAVQQWLNQFGSARVTISTDENFNLSDSALDLLLPLYDQKENLFFTQFGGRRNDDRNIINTGFGYRHFADRWMWGTNIFYDRQISGNQHERPGVGAELGWDYIKLSANGYFRLSDWMSSSRYTDYDERVANGFDIRATGYLPAYPQLGANVVYEQYYGDNVGLFGDDANERQKNPHAITFGLNYAPVPLVTFGVNQKFGKSGENDTQINLALNWTPGVPLSAQLDPSIIAARRSLMGGRQDLVDRNNNIVLEYRKQELISLALPAGVDGQEQSKQSVTAKVKTKYPLDHIEWQAASFINNGGKISIGSSPEQFVLTLPAWQGGGANSYTLTAQAWDKNGNASNTSEMKVSVNGIDVNTLQSSTTVSPTKIPADGTTTATVTVTLKTGTGEYATGLASRLSAMLIPVSANTVSKIADAGTKKPQIGDFSETSPGVYMATLTAGTTPDTLTIQPMIDATAKLATAKLIVEAVETISQLSALESSATSILGDGNTAITLTATVVDQAGKPVQNEQINWSADNSKVRLSTAKSVTNEQGQAKVEATSIDVATTVITAQHNQAESLHTETLSFTADVTSAMVASVVAEKSQVVANNTEMDKVTAKVTDSYGHLLDNVTVNWTVLKTDGASVKTTTSVTDTMGEATLTLKSSKIGTVTVAADINGANAKETGSITFVADTSTQKVDELLADKKQATANGSDSITYEAIVTDLQGNPVQGVVVGWSADNKDAVLSKNQTTTDASGKSQVSVTSLKAGAVVISAQTSESTAKQAESINFVADAATAKVTSVNGDKQSALANGADVIVVKATVTDAHDNLLPDAEVSWSVTPAIGKLSAQSSKTSSEGVAQVQLTSTDVNISNVTASINNSSLSSSNLSFTVDKTTSEVALLEADKLTAIVADKDTVALTATVMDASKHPVAGVTVNWSSSETSSTFTALSSVTDEIGQAKTSFSSLKAGNITVSATVGTSSQSQSLLVIGNAETAKFAAVTPDKTEEVADGVQAVTWTAKVVDANNNLLNGVTVNWSADNNDARLSSASSTTGESGDATISATSLKSGDVTMTTSITSPVAKSSARVVSFIGDLKTARMVKLVASTDHVAANTTPVTYTATVQDANDNPVKRTTVSWATNMNTLSDSTSDTSSSGVATMTLSGSEFGKATVTAETNGTKLEDNTVMFMGTVDDTWDIANGAASDVYKGETIKNFINLGFIVTGTTTGPTQLIWTQNYGAYSELTAPLRDENGVIHTVTFRGQVSNRCTVFEFNNASGCERPGNAPKITYDPSYGDNATLPAGKYSGVITFDGKDWHSSWALSYTVATTLTIN